MEKRDVTTRPRRRRRSAEQWTQLIEQQRRSGLTIAAFCDRESVASASFYQWRAKLGGAAGAGQAAAPSSQFVRLQTTTSATEQAVARFPDGVELHVGRELLPLLVAALRTASIEAAASASC